MKAVLTLFLSLLSVSAYCQQFTISGTVRSADGSTPPAGATVTIVGTSILTTTDTDGSFTLQSPQPSGKLSISYIGYDTQEVSFDSSTQSPITIQLASNYSTLDNVQVIGYGETTKRFNTGSVVSISAKEIEQQPVTNVLSALSGRMAGVFVQTTNGLPGGNIDIQIRGTGSIGAGTQPLYIIDGVQFDGGAMNTNAMLTGNSISGPITSMININPNDIESISILKDADATAIYGSRGSNGVVLITTKKGKTSRTSLEATLQTGFNNIANRPNLLSLEEYLMIRREAFENDGREPSADPTSPTYAPDLTVWNQTQETDWMEHLFGNTGSTQVAQARLVAGTEQTQFNVAGNFQTEETVLNQPSRFQRAGIQSQLQHSIKGDLLRVQIGTIYNVTGSNTPNPSISLAQQLLQAPNYPIFNEDGNYNWRVGANADAQMKALNKVNTENIIFNGLVAYKPAKDLKVTLSTGYNRSKGDQTQIFPTESLFPNTINYTNFGTNSNQSFLIEPQIDYTKKLTNANLSVLLGATYQNRIAQTQFIKASNFISTDLMENIASAGTIDSRTNSYIQNKFASVFGRINYNLKERYVFNATVRRDGSSRFGPENLYGTFGSFGFAWLFGEESLLKDNLSFLSFGKLRLSYGTTGNDQITDYQYLSTYTTSNPYQGVTSLRPLRIANPRLKWETTTKFDVNISLGFFNNRLMVDVTRYHNESNNQLVNYTLPSITGFPNYQANMEATVQNYGWEFELSSTNIQTDKFVWTSSFNLTLPRNILKSFENFENSSYRNTLEVGYDITRIYGYRLLGVNSQTGVAEYSDENGDISSSPFQFHTLGKRTPEFYGGLNNSLTILNRFQIDALLQFSKQDTWGGIGRLHGVSTYNMYSYALNRWQNVGDETNVPKSSTLADSYYRLSSANMFTVPYLRLKNIALSYNFSGHSVSRFLKAGNFNLFVQGHNLLTFWDRDIPIIDPESGAVTATTLNLPPVKTFVFGLKATF